MNILTDSPLITESPQESSARNLAIGQSFASSFLSGYNKAIDQKREDERWAELKPLRDAQVAAQQAQVDSAKSQAQLQAIQAAKQSMMQGKMAEFAALEGEVAFQEYSPESRVNFYGWLEKNPEFYGSQFHKDIESRFDNAERARSDKHRLDATLENQRTVAQIRESNQASTSSNLTIEQRERMRRELDAIDDDITLIGNESEKSLRRAEIYKKYNVQEPGQVPVAPASQQGVQRKKVVIGPDGNPVLESDQREAVAPQSTSAAAAAKTVTPTKKPTWLDAFMKLGPTDMR